jgi:hypothetical protein
MAYLAAQESRAGPAAARWRQRDLRRPAAGTCGRPVRRLGPPGHAVVLFDGSDLDAWQSPGDGPARWKVADGSMETVPGAGPIETKQVLGDVQLHVEWSAPDPPRGKGGARTAPAVVAGPVRRQGRKHFNLN